MQLPALGQISISRLGQDSISADILDPATQAKYKVLWKSDPLPPFVYAAHPRVAPNVVEEVRSALLNMNDNPEGRVLLVKVNIQSIEAAKDGDFESMRMLKLE